MDRNDATSPAPRDPREGTSRLTAADVWTVLILLGLSIVAYTSIGKIYARKTKEYQRTVLGVDSFAVMRHMCDRNFSPKYHRSTAHPLFTLFFKPLGISLSNHLGRPQAAMLINIIFAAIGNSLFYLCLRKIGLRTLIAILFSVFTASTTGHLIFSSIPETYAYAFTGLILLLLVFLFTNKFWFWIGFLLASLFSVGITMINVVFAVILFCCKFWGKFGIAKQLLYLMIFLFLLASSFVALIKLQKCIYPNSKDVFSQQLISSNTEFLRYELFSEPVRALTNRLPHLFVYNVVAPGMVRIRVAFPGFESLRPITLISMILHLLFLGISLWLVWQLKVFRNRVFVAVGSYFVFNVAFYLLYGYELHLYATHYTFALMILAAFPFTAEGLIPSRIRYALTGLLVLLIPLVAINNWTFLAGILADI